MVKVSRRGGFSDRQGIKSENTEIQLKDLDTRTRTQIYNLLSEQYKFIYQNIGYWNETIQSFFRYISSEVFCQKVDARNQIEDDAFFDKISQVIMNNSYDDVLTEMDADQTLDSATKEKLIKQVLSGRWFSYQLGKENNNLSDFYTK